MNKTGSVAVIAVLLAFVVAGCASAPVKPVTGYTAVIGEKAARTAETMVGKPYKFQGDSPSGFDCSGLVRYSYLTAGIEVPHSTEQLMKVTATVGLKNARKGDLLFFEERGKKYSHVGIYIGGNKFVHAPSSGKTVRRDNIEDSYWKKSFMDARRFH